MKKAILKYSESRRYLFHRKPVSSNPYLDALPFHSTIRNNTIIMITCSVYILELFIFGKSNIEGENIVDKYDMA